MKRRKVAEADTPAFCWRLESRVVSFIRRQGLMPMREGVLAGVSGGPDSLALLFILARRRQALGVRLAVAYFDHGLRGPEGQEEAAFVAALATELGLPFVSGRGDVRSHARAQGLSLEEAARELRYSFLGREAVGLGLALVAVGHTADDQAETVLLHLLRGSGIDGLAGMRPRSPWPLGPPDPAEGRSPALLRPLLTVTRAETEAYCRELGIVPRQDPTNLLLEPLRNRIRHELLPILRRYNPRVDRALCQLAEAAAAATDYLNEDARRLWPELVEDGREELRLRRQELAGLHPALRSRLLAGALRQAGQPSPAYAHLKALEEALTRGAGASFSLGRGLVAVVEPQFLALGKAAPPPSPLPETAIPIPGEVGVGPWLVQAEVMDSGAPVPTSDPFQAHLDLGALGGPSHCVGALAQVGRVGTGGPIVVRSRRPGDRFQPLGMSEAKKLQDLFVDAKVPRRDRDQVPLVCAPWGIAWVVGHRIAERAKITPASRRILRLRFTRREV